MFFAGHGLVIKGEGYLIPANAQRDNLDTYIPLAWLIAHCRNSKCAEALIILDACYGGRALVRPDQLSDQIVDNATNQRVLQLIASGNPDQPVLDGGAVGHSIFTRSLLDALAGWAGIHEANGSIRFIRLLDYLVFEVPGRLQSLGLRASHQQPIGGNLVGNRYQRDFLFQPTVARLPPEIVQDVRRVDPTYRRSALARLIDTCRGNNTLQQQAYTLALRSLKTTSDTHVGPLLGREVYFEPVAEVRVQAARTLGQLGNPNAVEPLIHALKDVDAVCSAAADALGKLADPRATAPLLVRLHSAESTLFLDLLGALGEIGEPDTILVALREALGRGKLVPFIGPDFAPALTGLPDRATVVAELARYAGVEVGTSLAKTATATMHRGSRHIFTAAIRHTLEDQLVRPGIIYQHLAELPILFWINGTYDQLLARSLEANAIVTGSDTQYWQPNRPTVVQLMGRLDQPPSLLVVEDDYVQLRTNESERKLLVNYLRNELQDKVVLFLGYDPDSPDFHLLVRYVLNGHLSSINAQAFLLWNRLANTVHRWNKNLIRPFKYDPLAFIEVLMRA